MPIATEFNLRNGQVIQVGTLQLVYTKQSILVDWTDRGTTSKAKRAILDSAFAPHTDLFQYNAPLCSSGDCEWPLYATLGVCSQVVNLTAPGNEEALSKVKVLASERLVRANSTLVSQLKYNFNASDELFPVLSLIITPTPFPTGAIDPSLLGLLTGDFIFAFSNGEIDATKPLPENIVDQYQLVEMVFYFCSKTFSTAVTDGRASSVEVATHARLLQASPLGLNMDWIASYKNCYLSNTCNTTLSGLMATIEGPPELPIKQNYNIDLWSALVASSLLRGAVNDAGFFDQFRGIVASAGGGTAEAFGAAVFGEYMSFQSPRTDEQLEAVQNITVNIARSLTNL